MTGLDDDSAQERLDSVDALPVDGSALDALLEALKDDSWRVRRLAADRLARLEPTPWLLDALVGALGRRGDTGARNAAAQVLSQLGAAAVPALTALLGHADPDQRKFAADILAGMRRPETVPALVDALHDADENVRAAAAEALGRVGGPEAVRALAALLEAPEPLLRLCALEAFASLKVPPSLPRLLPLLSAPLTRKSAFRVLGLVRHPAAQGRVARALADQATRDAGLCALAGQWPHWPRELFGEVRAALANSPDTRLWLGLVLEADDDERRLGALLVVAALEDAELAVSVAQSAESAVTAEAASRALVALGVPGARRLLEGETPAVLTLPRGARAVVADALLKTVDPSLVPALVSLLDCADLDVAELSARALGHSHAQEAIAPLAERLTDEVLAQHAAPALVQLASSWPAEVMEALDGVVALCLAPAAVRAFAEVAREASLSVLKRALHDEDPVVRAAAAEASPAVGSRAVELIGAALMDEVARVRRAAARALSRVASVEALPLVERALADESPQVVALACAAAGARALKPLSHRLEALAGHADVGVVLAATTALGTLGDLTDDLLQRLSRHADPEVLKLCLTVGADRRVLHDVAVDALGHAQWDVRVAAGRLLAVAGSRLALDILHQAIEREADGLARTLLRDAAGVLKER